MNPDNDKPLAIIDSIGRSYEKRNVLMAKISSDHSAEKPILFLEAGIHAREWLAPATALYIINQLVKNYTANKDVLEGTDFYIVPLTNPDGYEYSRLKVKSQLNCIFQNEFRTDSGLFAELLLRDGSPTNLFL